MENTLSKSAGTLLPGKKTAYRNGSSGYDMIVFCHLRWDFVYQRPQHIISRMARTMRVLFVEEPIGHAPAEEGTANLLKISENLHVLQPRVWDIASIASVLPREVLGGGVSLAWFYSAAFVPLLDTFRADTVVYDCMDELSLFKGAAESLIGQEKLLLSEADIVFTGGRSLYDSKKNKHANVHCFPSSVDQEHFGQEIGKAQIPADIASIPGPVVGYFGVIDERIDLGLIQQTAAENPDVSLVMIGPLAKIGQDDLPRAANLHYLGMKSYEALPHYLRAFDIAMMPFALNDATRYISPTKTLEYMAAGKPIISTRIADTMKDYRDDVAFVDDAEDFGSAIRDLLSQTTAPDYSHILAKTSWDATAAQMEILMNAVFLMSGADIVIVGAGISGAVLAERYAQSGKRVLVIEKRDHIAGNCYDSIDENGILVSRYGAHLFHTNDRGVWEYVNRFAAWYPWEHKVLARVDGMTVPIPVNITTVNALMGEDIRDEDGMRQWLEANRVPFEKPADGREAVLNRVGEVLYEKMFRHYTKKQWDKYPEALDASVLERIPVRHNRDDRYFSDEFQALPAGGYTKMFEKMFSHPNIEVRLDTDYFDIADSIGSFDKLFYTGPIDRFFEFREGLHEKLEYRSIRFVSETCDMEFFQENSVVNYPGTDVDFTRIIEYKHFGHQVSEKTTVVREFTVDDGDPYYPVPNARNQEVYERYKAKADRLTDVYFVGRLANYKYFNMDQAFRNALDLYAALEAAQPVAVP